MRWMTIGSLGFALVFIHVLFSRYPVAAIAAGNDVLAVLFGVLLAASATACHLLLKKPREDENRPEHLVWFGPASVAAILSFGILGMGLMNRWIGNVPHY